MLQTTTNHLDLELRCVIQTKKLILALLTNLVRKTRCIIFKTLLAHLLGKRLSVPSM